MTWNDMARQVKSRKMKQIRQGKGRHSLHHMVSLHGFETFNLFNMKGFFILFGLISSAYY